MWNIRGHEIQFGGGDYDFDSEDPRVMVHCLRCPDGSTDGWDLWFDPDESGRPVPPAVGVAVASRHLRESGIDVPQHVEDGAAFMGGLQNDAEAGLQVLHDDLESNGVPGFG